MDQAQLEIIQAQRELKTYYQDKIVGKRLTEREVSKFLNECISEKQAFFTLQPEEFAHIWKTILEWASKFPSIRSKFIELFVEFLHYPDSVHVANQADCNYISILELEGTKVNPNSPTFATDEQAELLQTVTRFFSARKVGIQPGQLVGNQEEFIIQKIHRCLSRMTYERQRAFIEDFNPPHEEPEPNFFDTYAPIDTQDYFRKPFYSICLEDPDLMNVNVLTMGHAGAGKTCLLNCVLGLRGTIEELPESVKDGRGGAIAVGSVPPHVGAITKTWNVNGIEKQFRSTDYAGLEVTKEAKKLEKIRDDIINFVSGDPPVDVVWFCVGNRTSAISLEIARILSATASVIVVVPNAYIEDALNRRREEISNDLVGIGGLLHSFVGVNSKETRLAGGIVIQEHGIGELMRQTADAAKKTQLARTVDFRQNPQAFEALRKMLRFRAHIVIHSFALLCSGAAATPIPFTELIFLTPLHCAMLASLNAIYHIGFSRQVLVEIAGALFSVLASSGLRIAATWLTLNVLKFVPFANIAGMAIMATSAYVFTVLAGYSYAMTLEQLIRSGQDRITDANIKELTKACQDRLREQLQADANKAMERIKQEMAPK